MTPVALTSAIFAVAVSMIFTGGLLKLAPGISRANRAFREAANKMPFVDAVFFALGSTNRAVPSLFASDAQRLDELLTGLGLRFGGLDAGRFRLAVFRLALIVGGFVACLILITSTPGLGALVVSLGLGLFLMLTIWISTHFIVRRVSDERATQISRDLPYYLDLSLLVVQAGGQPRDAIALYISIFEGRALADELKLLQEEGRTIRFGEALERLRLRIRNPAVRNIIGNLAQSQRVGAKIEDSLMEQAVEIRAVRSDMAEREAEELTAKFRLPVALLLVSAVLMMMSPAIVALLDLSLF